jgi:glycosyltransferase involved in cell wall biosynthesis
LIKQSPVEGIIVNSRAAAALVRKDLELAKLTIPIIEAFHPVFPPTVPMPIHRKAQSPIVVGTFGVPNRAKRTEIVHEAVRRLARRGLARELVVAGDGVSTYLDRLNLDRSFVRAVDAPGDTDLQALMAEVDVAVQLRRKDRGESSGIVPQLLALGKPVVVSSIGSFRELGDVVIQIDEKADPDDVACSILHATGNSERLRQASGMYCAQHTPEIFMKVLEHATQRLEP